MLTGFEEDQCHLQGLAYLVFQGGFARTLLGLEPDFDHLERGDDKDCLGDTCAES